jgi:hypothetical protein
LAAVVDLPTPPLQRRLDRVRRNEGLQVEFEPAPGKFRLEVALEGRQQLGRITAHRKAEREFGPDHA